MRYDAEELHGGEIYRHRVELDFSVNVNPLGTPPGVREAVKKAAELVHRYPDPNCRELTAAIAGKKNVPEDHILCGNGAAELIYALCAALRPRKALIPVPTFSEYETALEAAGCRVRHFPLRPEDGFDITAALPEALERTDAELVVLCNPNNPTGRLIPHELLRRIVRICEKRGVRLLMDECFLDLTGEREARSMKRDLSGCPNLFLLNAFTKSCGMAGVRLGYGMSADQTLLSAMRQTLQPWNVSLPAQLAGVAALGEDAFLEQARAVIAEQRERLTGGLGTLGFQVIPSDANFILFQSEKELKAPLLDRGILIRDCANFPGLGNGWYRVAVKLPGENARLLAVLEEIVHG